MNLNRGLLKQDGLTDKQLETVATELEALDKAKNFNNGVAYIIGNVKIWGRCASVEDVLRKVLAQGSQNGNQPTVHFIPWELQEKIHKNCLDLEAVLTTLKSKHNDTYLSLGDSLLP